MPKTTTWKRVGHEPYRFTHKRFTPYALAIGRASLAWNYLHEALAVTFAVVTNSPHNDMKAIWYSQNYDRPRRDLLGAAVENRRLYPLPGDPKEPCREEIKWMLGEINKLEEARNNVIHSPLQYFTEDVARMLQTKPGVFPMWDSGNPRALRLKDKDLLIEFRWLRDRTTALTIYAVQILMAWNGHAPLPDRPKLPTREHQKSHRGARRQLRPK